MSIEKAFLYPCEGKVRLLSMNEKLCIKNRDGAHFFVSDDTERLLEIKHVLTKQLCRAIITE